MVFFMIMTKKKTSLPSQNKHPNHCYFALMKIET